MRCSDDTGCCSNSAWALSLFHKHMICCFGNESVYQWWWLPLWGVFLSLVKAFVSELCQIFPPSVLLLSSDGFAKTNCVLSFDLNTCASGVLNLFLPEQKRLPQEASQCHGSGIAPSNTGISVVQSGYWPAISQQTWSCWKERLRRWSRPEAFWSGLQAEPPNPFWKKKRIRVGVVRGCCSLPWL